MATSLSWRATDLLLLPEDGNRYEVIDGELHVTTQPSWGHQTVAMRIGAALDDWGTRTGAGMANTAPSVILAVDQAVAPDVVWVSARRLPRVLGRDGKLHAAPDLVAEILSPGATNEKRDRDAKLRLYSRYGVREYWIVDWPSQAIAVYRRQEAALVLAATLHADDALMSPLLPGFTLRVAQLFVGLEPAQSERTPDQPSEDDQADA